MAIPKLSTFHSLSTFIVALWHRPFHSNNTERAQVGIFADFKATPCALRNIISDMERCCLCAPNRSDCGSAPEQFPLLFHRHTVCRVVKQPLQIGMQSVCKFVYQNGWLDMLCLPRLRTPDYPLYMTVSLSILRLRIVPSMEQLLYITSHILLHIGYTNAPSIEVSHRPDVIECHSACAACACKVCWMASIWLANASKFIFSTLLVIKSSVLAGCWLLPFCGRQ